MLALFLNARTSLYNAHNYASVIYKSLPTIAPYIQVCVCMHACALKYHHIIANDTQNLTLNCCFGNELVLKMKHPVPCVA